MKIPDNVERYLRYPLYTLYHTDDLSNFSGIVRDGLNAFLNQYDSDLQFRILDALRWVVEHPTSDLTSVLPNLPCNNGKIHEFCERVYSLSTATEKRIDDDTRNA